MTLDFKKLLKYGIFFISYIVVFALLYLLFTRRLDIRFTLVSGIISTVLNYIFDTIPLTKKKTKKIEKKQPETTYRKENK